MPLYSGRAKSKLRSGYNWSESSVIVQKKKKILGLLNPRLNPFPIFKKIFHHFLLQQNANFILSPNTVNARTIERTVKERPRIRSFELEDIKFVKENSALTSWDLKGMYFFIRERLMTEMDEKAKKSDQSVKEWLDAFNGLGKKLRIKVDS